MHGGGSKSKDDVMLTILSSRLMDDKTYCLQWTINTDRLSLSVKMDTTEAFEISHTCMRCLEKKGVLINDLNLNVRFQYKFFS